MPHTPMTDALTQPVAASPETALASDREDPDDHLTPEQQARFAVYMAAPKVLPKPGVDRNGMRLPVTESEEERAARWEGFKRRMAEIDAEDDDPPDLWDRIEREMNEERASEGRGPAFPKRP